MKRIKVRNYRVITLSLLLGLSLVRLSLLLVHPPVSRAAGTLTVNSEADAGGTCLPGATCTLRQAIATASFDDVIDFAPGLSTITLTSGELLLDKRLMITGPGAKSMSTPIGGSARSMCRVPSENARKRRGHHRTHVSCQHLELRCPEERSNHLL